MMHKTWRNLDFTVYYLLYVTFFKIINQEPIV